MAAGLLKTEKIQLPASLFIGRRYTERDRKNGSFSHKWQEWFQNGLFSPLEALGSLPEHGDSYIGLMCIQNGEFAYWIGMFFPAGTAVPPGYASISVPAGDYGICWVYGSEQNGEIYGEQAYQRCLQALQAQGWRYPEGGWCFERYNCPRFTTPDEKGNVILDYGFIIEG